jgi:type II secretory pathway pseudopilin PulG
MLKRRHGRSGGFTYLGLMIFVALLGIGLALVGQVWHTAVVREKERELLFIGGQIRKAIEAFRARNPAADDGYPKSFDELLRDPHQPGIQRHLRKLYTDPLTGNAEWGLIRSPRGGIAGVYSLGKGAPLKQGNFPAQYEQFASAESYGEWTFLAADSGSEKVAAAVPGGSPGAQPAPPPEVPPANAPEDLSDRDPTKEPTCAWVAANDLRLCNQEKTKWRDEAVACFASRQLRASYCATGVRPNDLPALDIRFGSGR